MYQRPVLKTLRLQSSLGAQQTLERGPYATHIYGKKCFFLYEQMQVKETVENVFVRYSFVLFVCFILAHHPSFSFSQ